MNQNGINDSQTPKTAPSKPPHRRLVVMFDGTGNTRESMSNVSRLFEAIDDSHPDSYKSFYSGSGDWPSYEGPASSKIVHSGTCNQPMLKPAKFEGDVLCDSCNQCVVEPEREPVQLVKYITGVNREGVIAWLSAHVLGLVGYGLSDKIKEGYTWLCENYQSEEDEVFVFGFSEGAFAARSLVSLLEKCNGVLKKSDDLGESEQKKEDKGAINPKPLPKKVKMLGVWDTGCFGVPKTHVSSIDSSVVSQTQYQFHDQGVSCIVENAYHALALDEDLSALEPILWTSRDRKNIEVKQVWFAGSQGNVGGGADLDDNEDPDDLWQYSYVWMQKHAQKHGLRFYWSFEYPATRQFNSKTEQYSRSRRLSLREPRPSLKNVFARIYSRLVKQYTRKPNPEFAMLHWSVVERMKIEGENPTDKPGPTLLHKAWNRFLQMLPWSVFGRRTWVRHCYTKLVGSPLPKPTGYLLPKSLVGIHTSCRTYAEFLETVITEDSMEVIAPDQVKDTPEWTATKWHIETDDVKGTQWRLPLSKPEQQLPLPTKQPEPGEKKE